MIVQVAGSHPASFGEGLAYAARLIQEAFTSTDPSLFRCLASCTEASATTAFEIGLAAGLRLHAEDLTDIEDAWADSLERSWEVG